MVSRLVVNAAVVAIAMAASQAPVPQFRTRVDLIQIDVTVLDADRRPVRGLTAADFTLIDEGQPQEIRGFAEIHIPDATDGPRWIRDASPDVRTADDGRVLVFVLDDAQVRNDLHTATSIATIKRIAAEMIDRMGPTDSAAVICTFDARCAVNFTTDRALLKAAVARFQPKSFNTAGGRGSWGYDWHRQSAGVTASVVKYLIEQPGRRKAMIYVSPRIPVRPETWPPPCPPDCKLEDNVTLQQIMRTFEHAFRSKVTVYGISPSGMQALSTEDPEDAGSLLAANRDAAAPPKPARLATPPRSLTTETGGFLIQGSANLADGVAQIFRETGSYYLLGYEAPSHPPTGYRPIDGYRAIEVRVNRPDLTVRGKTGYVVAPPEKPVAKPPPAGDAALAGILPKNDLPLHVSVAPFAVPGSSEAVLAIVLGVRQPAPTARTMDGLNLQFRAFTPRGEPRGMTRQHLDAIIPAGPGGEVLFEVLSDLRLKPGQYALRFAAESERLGKAGSVYADVEVPDFAKASLSLSGVLLTSEPRPPAAPADALAAFVPIVPTTLREFGDRHRASAFVRIYQGGRSAPEPVTVTARVLDEASRVIAEHVEVFEPARFATARAADFRYALPFSGVVAPGLHLLRIEATRGTTTVRRDVRFSVVW
jgi:VWFA-related protein